MNSSSDYIAVKKQMTVRSTPIYRRQNAQVDYLVNRQYVVLQTTYEMDEDGDLVCPSRYGMSLPLNFDLASCHMCIDGLSLPYIWSVPNAPDKYNKFHTRNSFSLAPRRFLPFIAASGDWALDP